MRVFSTCIVLTVLIGPVPSARAAETPRIAVITDGPSDLFDHATRLLATEVNALLGEGTCPNAPTARGDFTAGSAEKLLQAALASSEIDWVVVPSIWWENSPVVIEEAFCHGRPVISSDIGGMAEKVNDGIDGIHFKVGSPKQLANRIEAVVNGEYSWDELHENTRAPLSVPDSADAHLALYADLKRAATLRIAEEAHAEKRDVWAPDEHAAQP